MSIYNRNRSNISIQVNKDQQMSKSMWEEIQRAGQEALQYLPPEDKVNLALASTSLPVVPEPDAMRSMRDRYQQLEETLAATQELLGDLEKAKGKK